MNSLNSRAHARFQSSRKRRRFGPRRSSRFVKAKHWAKMHGHLGDGSIGSYENFSFVTTPLTSPE